MSSTKINYGIDLGTTNSAICRYQNGELRIFKTNLYQKDILPSCIYITKKGQIQFGEQAYHKFPIDPENVFIEFKRTMGTDYKYFAPNTGKEYSPEELSAEVLKTLKSQVTDDEIDAVIITVPAKFDGVQTDATKRASNLAGFQYCELLQEPIAASLAYAVDYKTSDGYWLVFDFGGGTFDAALMSSFDGIMKVQDTEGDNHLGGKNFDYIIIDEIVLPYLIGQYSLDTILNNEKSKKSFRNSIKPSVEVAKILLSTQNSTEITIEKMIWKDDSGNEIELDMTIHRSEYEELIRPLIQRSIDKSILMLNRNHLNYSELKTILMVGGPTFTPLMRNMVKEQISEKINVTIDPMTVVAKGAAIFASTCERPENIQKADKSKVQLKLKYPSSTPETEVNLAVKVERNKSEKLYDEILYINIIRYDKDFITDKIYLEEDVAIIELKLVKGKVNSYNIEIFDSHGNKLECEPNNISIFQGSTIPDPVMASDLGIAVDREISGEIKTFMRAIIKKNMRIPVSATEKGFKTQRDVRPGNIEDKIEFEVLEGEDGTKPIRNKRRAIFYLTGEDVSKFIPAGTEIEITMKVDKDRGINMFVYFPLIDEEFEFKITGNKTIPLKKEELDILINDDADKLNDILDYAELSSTSDNQKIKQIKDKLQGLIDENDKGDGGPDICNEIKNRYNELMIEFENHESIIQLKIKKNELDEIISIVNKNLDKFGDEEDMKQFTELNNHVKFIKDNNDLESMKNLLLEFRRFNFRMLSKQIGFWIQLIMETDKYFDTYQWKPGASSQAKSIIAKAKREIAINPNLDSIRDYMYDLWDLMEEESKEKSKGAFRPQG